MSPWAGTSPGMMQSCHMRTAFQEHGPLKNDRLGEQLTERGTKRTASDQGGRSRPPLSTFPRPWASCPDHGSPHTCRGTSGLARASANGPRPGPVAPSELPMPLSKHLKPKLLFWPRPVPEESPLRCIVPSRVVSELQALSVGTGACAPECGEYCESDWNSQNKTPKGLAPGMPVACTQPTERPLATCSARSLAAGERSGGNTCAVSAC